jgi:hypothetical protein
MIKLSKEQRQNLLIVMDAIAIILLASILIYIVTHAQAVISANYDHCTLCVRDNFTCFKGIDGGIAIVKP